MKVKRCYVCQQDKPLTAFYKNKTKKDGLATECKECKRTLDKISYLRNREKHLQKMRKYRQDNLERLRKYERDYSRSKQGRKVNNKAEKKYYKTHKQQKSDYAKRYRKNNPVKYEARYQFSNATKLGKIQRPTHCQMCGVECITNGHHSDYLKPYDVLFVCDSCHGKLHRKVV